MSATESKRDVSVEDKIWDDSVSSPTTLRVEARRSVSSLDYSAS